MLQNPNAVKKSQTSNPGNIKLTCIDRIHIYIKDTLKIIEFQQDILGFKISEGEVGDGFIILGEENIQLCFM